MKKNSRNLSIRKRFALLASGCIAILAFGVLWYVNRPPPLRGTRGTVQRAIVDFVDDGDPSNSLVELDRNDSTELFNLIADSSRILIPPGMAGYARCEIIHLNGLKDAIAITTGDIIIVNESVCKTSGSSAARIRILVQGRNDRGDKEAQSRPSSD